MGALRCHTPLLHLTLSPRVFLTGSPYSQVVSQDFMSSSPLSLLPLLSSLHPLSLCLVCLPSQLLSKKRGLFRIHAGRKQRYPRLQACARGTQHINQINTTTLTPPLTHKTRSACLKYSKICGLAQWFTKLFVSVIA